MREQNECTHSLSHASDSLTHSHFISFHFISHSPRVTESTQLAPRQRSGDALLLTHSLTHALTLMRRDSSISFSRSSRIRFSQQVFNLFHLFSFLFSLILFLFQLYVCILSFFRLVLFLFFSCSFSPFIAFPPQQQLTIAPLAQCPSSHFLNSFCISFHVLFFSLLYFFSQLVQTISWGH